MLLRYLLHLSLWSYLAYATASSKRGLIYISDTDDVTEDVHYYTSSSSDLTWYYNYGASPSSDLENSTLQFVPMLWGADDGYDTFLSTIQNLIGNGTNITHVLGFNEPDGDRDTGGSSIDADTAAEAWISQIQPLRKQGVKLGLPAVTGSASGLAWLKKFNESCDGDCTADFIPIHWYGNFEGLASYIGQIRAAYPNLTIWVTEFAYSSEDLSTSQSFYNQSTQYFDRLE
ncbi:MAG: hypothetical protein M1834_003794 [Cirrosporium novae-zelandiae]|nr:MAG: hypothetical protein M1834_003794 [Cirrosporium novae-zelandiae]